MEKPSCNANMSSLEEANHAGNVSESAANASSDGVSSESFVSGSQKNTSAAIKSVETPLLDERSLLACIVRTIPPGGRIRISSTVSYPNFFALLRRKCFAFRSPLGFMRHVIL